MTTATAITSRGQGSRRRSPTEPLPLQDFSVSIPGTTVPSDHTTQGSTQAEQSESAPSTWDTPVKPFDSRGVTGLYKWEGKILEIDGDAFTAELYPIDAEGMPITADFDLELFGSDAATVVPGDVFYLSVRTVKAPGMRPTRTENLRLRRLGRVTLEEVQAVYARADALMEHLEQLFD